MSRFREGWKKRIGALFIVLTMIAPSLSFGVSAQEIAQLDFPEKVYLGESIQGKVTLSEGCFAEGSALVTGKLTSKDGNQLLNIEQYRIAKDENGKPIEIKYPKHTQTGIYKLVFAFDGKQKEHSIELRERQSSWRVEMKDSYILGDKISGEIIVNQPKSSAVVTCKITNAAGTQLLNVEEFAFTGASCIFELGYPLFAKAGDYKIQFGWNGELLSKEFKLIEKTNKPYIKSHESLLDITVAYGGKLELPQKVKVIYSDGSEQILPVKWTSSVDTSKTGEYNLKGIVAGDYEVSLKVIVKAKEDAGNNTGGNTGGNNSEPRPSGTGTSPKPVDKDTQSPKPPVMAPNNVDGFIKQLQDLKAANKKLTATEAMDQLKGMLSKENLNNLKALNPANYNQVMLAALSYGQELLMAGGRQDVSQKATVVSGQKVFNISKEMLKGGLSKSETLYKEIEKVSKEQAKKLAPVALIDLGAMSLKDNVKVTLEGLSEVNGQVRIASNQMQMLLAESLRPEQLVIESQPVSAEIQSQLAAKKGFTGFVRDISLRAGHKALTPDQMPWVSFSISEAIQKGFDPNKLAVFIFDPASQSYERVSSTRIGDTLNFKAPHFSIYTIMENQVTFKDMNKHWAKEAVEVLGAKAIVNGDAAGNFEPSRQITRAEFTAMLVNALDLKADTQANFKDVESKAWYSQQIAAAKAKGLVTGNEKGEFRPNEAITRQEMAALVARAYQIDKGLALVGEGVSFTDQTDIASYAQDAVQGAQYYHLISGYKDGSFKPKANATRAEAAKVIYQLITLN